MQQKNKSSLLPNRRRVESRRSQTVKLSLQCELLIELLTERGESDCRYNINSRQQFPSFIHMNSLSKPYSIKSIKFVSGFIPVKAPFYTR
jgi:hypothetical protein